MERIQSLRVNPQLLATALRPSPPSVVLLRSLRQSLQPIRAHHLPSRRHASSSTPSSKPIVLEQPDKFRPPSHGQRMVGRRPGRGGAYNQMSTPREVEHQRTRKYPHMFPNEGTFMHWFLTNKIIHLWITLGTLILLAFYSLSQTFLHTSPYAHLLPPWNSLLRHPLNFIRESWSVFRLHLDYTTQIAAESRAQAILDAQKRRIFRRANGMEDLDAEDDQGVDVRGIVPWDDGLTNKERERGGRRVQVTSSLELQEKGQPGESLEEYSARKREEQAMKVKDWEEKQQAVMVGDRGEVIEQQPQRKRKLWLGIW